MHIIYSLSEEAIHSGQASIFARESRLYVLIWGQFCQVTQCGNCWFATKHLRRHSLNVICCNITFKTNKQKMQCNVNTWTVKLPDLFKAYNHIFSTTTSLYQCQFVHVYVYYCHCICLCVLLLLLLLSALLSTNKHSKYKHTYNFKAYNHTPVLVCFCLCVLLLLFFSNLVDLFSSSGYMNISAFMFLLIIISIKS